MENLRQKFKLFNYRPLVLVFLGIASGILINHFISYQTAICVVGIILVVGVLLFYSILHKKFKYFAIFGITFVLGFSTYAIFTNTNQHKQLNYQYQYAIGTISSIKTYDNCLCLLLEDVEVDNEPIGYNVEVYYYNSSQSGYIALKAGARIGFNISKQKEVAYYSEGGLPNTYVFNNNIGAEFTTYEIKLLDEKDSVRTSLLSRIRDNLRFGLNNLNSEMIYSAMFGDKTYLNHDLYDAYKGAGVAHLLAVSGLHVGLVVAIIYWILNKLKVKGWYRVAIVVALLFGYAYLCNFSYSILRASIMAIVLMIAPIMFREYDLLSSICFAGAAILVIEPMALFDLSAQLSFGCVFGIAMLTPTFQRWFKKVPIPSGIKDGFCISLSTIISTAVFMAYYFKQLQPISLISNIIILPIFSILFTIVFIVAMLSLILPFVCYALNLINPLFEWLNWAIIFMGNIAKPIMTPNVNYLTIILFCVLLAFASKYNLYKRFNKFTMVSACVGVLALQMALI